MKLEEYREKLTELDRLPWNECYQKIAELQAEYLSEQVVADAETAWGIAGTGCCCEFGGLQKL
jgi:hypothetical protein